MTHPILLDALTTTCQCLAASLDDAEAKASTLSSRGQALAVVDLMRQIVSQSHCDATASDFAGAAQWLAGWYVEQHAAAVHIGASASPLLLGADGKAAQSASHSLPPHLVEGLARGAGMWGEVVRVLSTDGGHLDMLKRYETWSAQSAEEPEADLLEYFGAVQPVPCTLHGVMRIWTHIVAALVTMLYGGGTRSRQEAVALAMMLGQLSREAAAMAQGMVGAVAGVTS